MKRIVLSPSSLSLFLECPRCFWLQVVKGVRRPASVFPSLPSGMDKILKEHFDRHRRENTHPEELHNLKGRLFQDIERLKVWRNPSRGLRFEDPETGIILMGAIDDLFITEDGLYAPIDFKTRGFPVKENTANSSQNQMDIYTFLLEKNELNPARFAILLYYHPITVNSFCNVEFHAETVKIPTNPKNAESVFYKAIEVIRGEIPERSKNCEFCNWSLKTSIERLEI